MRGNAIRLCAALLALAGAVLQADAQTGSFIKDNTTGCKVWHESGDPADSVTWKGACKSGYAAGVGLLTWYSADRRAVATYAGHMKAGRIMGRGVYTIPGSGVAEGIFVNGLLEGRGRMTSEDGVLAGNFAHGEFLDLDKAYLDRLHKTKLGIRDRTRFYSVETDSLFYYALVPAGAAAGALVLLAGTGEQAEYVISSNKRLMQRAADEGLVCIVPAINYNKELNIDTAALHFLNSVFTDAIGRYKIPGKFVLCGLSLGGCNALLYTALSRSRARYTSVRPVAVIGIDPPVDNADLYNNAEEEIQRYADTTNLTAPQWAALREDRFLIRYFMDEYGSSPANAPAAYSAGSAFSRRAADGGNAKYLAQVPVRLYNDPDILWNLQVKGRDYYHMNAANHAAMILCLLRLGNRHAELVPALGKGYRLGGRRHPHSWSIAAPAACVKWIMQFIR